MREHMVYIAPMSYRPAQTPKPKQEPNMTDMQKEIVRLSRENAAMRRAQGIAQPTVQYTRKAGPVAPVPTFIVERAKSKNTNHLLAEAIRAAGGQASGKTWKIAKDYLSRGMSITAAAIVGVRGMEVGQSIQS
jgi:hypothetical protein